MPDDDSQNGTKPTEDRQEALTITVEEALPAAALALLTTAEARYAAAVTATDAPVTVTTTTAA
jgi:hypothetical protein